MSPAGLSWGAPECAVRGTDCSRPLQWWPFLRPCHVQVSARAPPAHLSPCEAGLAPLPWWLAIAPLSSPGSPGTPAPGAFALGPLPLFLLLCSSADPILLVTSPQSLLSQPHVTCSLAHARAHTPEVPSELLVPSTPMGLVCLSPACPPPMDPLTGMLLCRFVNLCREGTGFEVQPSAECHGCCGLS